MSKLATKKPNEDIQGGQTIDFSSYYDFEAPSGPVPLFCWASTFAFDRLTGHPSTSLGLQRKQTQRFRKDFAQARQHPKSEILLKNNSFNDVKANLEEQGQRAALVVDMLEKFPRLEFSQKCNLIYVLLSAGFYNAAVDALTSIPISEPRLAVLRWLSRDLQNYGTIGDVGLEGLSLLNSIPKVPEAIRCRFNLFLQLVVYFSQRKNIKVVQELKIQGSEILSSIGCLDETRFTAEIMKSKFHRSFSYIAFLENDLHELRRQNNLIEFHALEAKPGNAKEEIIWSENIFPMLESTARIFAFLGDKEEALLRLQLIVKDVDPLDSKAWFQLGDFQLGVGDSRAARQSYLNSYNCALPHAHLAAFKLGALCEIEGDYEPALQYYLDSLAHEPDGLTPLLRVLNLSQRLGKTKEQSMVTQKLQQLVKAGSASSRQILQIQEALQSSQSRAQYEASV